MSQPISQPAKIAILTDSSADIPASFLREYDIHTLPLKICFEDRVYLDGVEITPGEVYRRMPLELPKTSLPDGEMILKMFDRIRNAGFTHVLALHMSSGLSGTYNAVRLFAEQHKEMNIAVFDSKSASLGLGMSVLQAAMLVRDGASWDALLQQIAPLLETSKAFFSVDTLEYLQKGGRIGKITCIAGSMLQIKPTISFAGDGQLVSIGKVRGRAKAIEDIAARVKALVPQGRPYQLFVVDGEAPQDVCTLKELLAEEIAGSVRFYEGQIDSTLATHVGPQLIGAGIQTL